MAKQFFWKDYFVKKGRKDIMAEIDKKYYDGHKKEILTKKKAYYLANRDRLKLAAKLKMREKRAKAKLFVPESV